ncbi:Glycosyl hydrolase family 67 N-terminus [bacterium A37T11]|nr:Glycosyl hydrolase family 67 N-terminus [bacterium A37T11]
MNRILHIFIGLLGISMPICLLGGKPLDHAILFERGSKVNIYIGHSEKDPVLTALSLLQRDVHAVFDASLAITNFSVKAQIVVGTWGLDSAINRLVRKDKIDISVINGKWEAFLLKTVETDGHKKLVIIGSDTRGTAYGLLELSRLIGVSPWEWWADVHPAKSTNFLFPEELLVQSPTIKYRGIFLNDEDWGLSPWSSQTFEPTSQVKVGIDPKKLAEKKVIGPKTYARIFELLLRLRANTIWPAMHEVTLPFYFVEGTREMANKYGIIVGTSHCEPLMRNSVTEWDVAGKGDYNYVTNKDNLLSYWSERLKELKGSENIYTIGLRGKHDGMMQGVKTTRQHMEVLSQVLKDERTLIKTYVNGDVTKVPQVFIPYKEVLEVYDAGLKVPDDVTLVWPDDNFGYIRHFPNNTEKKRSGGNGIYYHISYWGSPHDYLWLGTTSPALIYQQLSEAYKSGIQKIWMVNVGDIKPAEYQMELFLDMAWNITSVTNVTDHLKHFLIREFGETLGNQLVPLIQKHYQLAYKCKPEFLGHSRVYDDGRAAVTDLPWSEREISDRLMEYGRLSDRVERLAAYVPADKMDAFFELIQYPIQAATQMNRKMLWAQLARHSKASWQLSDQAFDSIGVLTNRYNELNNGKWNRMMDFQPRKLPVFERVQRESMGVPMVVERAPVHVWNGADCADGSPIVYDGLGYQGNAAGISKGTSLTFSFDHLKVDAVQFEIRLLPSHSIRGKQLRFSLSLDGGVPKVFDYETKEFSEEWKENVLRNQAIRVVNMRLKNLPKHRLEIKALDEGVILDQVLLFSE